MRACPATIRLPRGGRSYLALTLDWFDPDVSLDSGAPAARMPRLAGAVLRSQPDHRLAELAGEGSRPAFDELARRHRGRLVAFAGSIAPPGAADDVVQEAILKAYLALRRGDLPESPKAWLYTIVRNTALNHRRGWRPHDQLDESIPTPPSASGASVR
jgi:RNA polymerase sigma-70 factor (ECF subfamily)